MNRIKSGDSKVTDSWNTYWQGTGNVGAYSSGGVNHPAILTFWNEFFEDVKQNYNMPRIIDIASGNGALARHALAAFGDEQPDMTCLDVSDAAVANIRDQFPWVNVIVSDARRIPRESESFDIVTSQFGVEYAGQEAIDEAARLLATGGKLALMLHSKTGSIHHECEQSLDAIVQLKDSNFIPYAIEMFTAGFEAVRGADRSAYEAAATKFAPTVRVPESIMKQYGQHVAGDTIARLYHDVGRIHYRIQNYEPGEVLDWLNRMDREIDAYAERMSSMSAAAIDSDAFERVCNGFRSLGLTMERAEPLVVSVQDLPLAWVLIVTKSVR